MRLFILAIVVSYLGTGAEIAAAKRGLPAELLMPKEAIVDILLSPGGEWIVARAFNEEKAGILAQQVGTGIRKLAFSARHGIISMTWVGRHKLLVVYALNEVERCALIDFRSTLDTGFETELSRFPKYGELIDGLPLDDERILWSLEHGQRTTAHRVSLDDLARFRPPTGIRGRPKSIILGEQVASIEGSVRRWIIDRSGRPVAAHRRNEDGYSTLFRESTGTDFHEVYESADADSDFIKPFTTTSDGKRLLVTSYNGMDTIGLFEFDPIERRIEREVYRRNDEDLTSIHTDPVTRDLVSASYEVGGETQYHYFDEYLNLYRNTIGKEHESHRVLVVSGSADREKFIYWASGPTEPGLHVYRDHVRDETIPVGRIGQRIERSRLSDTTSFQVTSRDGTTIEAFLTLPRNPMVQPSPLIVMPHGGPINVRDRKEYDPILQYFASWGFAVLQPNYRGSSGYGRTFRDEGKGEWARGIEDDIDAAVEHAIDRPEIDENRICIVGGSYGGFSALAGVIRHKKRYRCAVTINGVSDILLLGESSDFADSEKSLRAFQESAGHFQDDREQLLAASPAYHLRDVEVPILVVYGDSDRRVDPDHSHRVMLMLELYRKDAKEVVIKNAGHSPSRENWIRLLPVLREFLNPHLMPSIAFQRDPGVPSN